MMPLTLLSSGETGEIVAVRTSRAQARRPGAARCGAECKWRKIKIEVKIRMNAWGSREREPFLRTRGFPRSSSAGPPLTMSRSFL